MRPSSSLSRRDRLLAAPPDLAPLASRLPWLFNRRDRLPGAAAISEKLLGLSAKRTLPKWRGDTFWRAKDAAGLAGGEATLAAARAGEKAVVLFVDTFNGHFESENARAAARVLRAAGYAVHVPGADGRPLCCGRTCLAAGMVDAARAKLVALVDALAPFSQAGVSIVGLEPSCLYTLRDEAQVMGLGPRAEAVAAKAVMFEEFVAAEVRSGRFALNLEPAAAPILLHGHCQGKTCAPREMRARDLRRGVFRNSPSGRGPRRPRGPLGRDLAALDPRSRRRGEGPVARGPGSRRPGLLPGRGHPRRGRPRPVSPRRRAGRGHHRPRLRRLAHRRRHARRRVGPQPADRGRRRLAALPAIEARLLKN